MQEGVGGMSPCHNDACAEADPLSPYVCRCGGWGHAAKTQPGLFHSEDMTKAPTDAGAGGRSQAVAGSS